MLICQTFVHSDETWANESQSVWNWWHMPEKSATVPNLTVNRMDVWLKGAEKRFADRMIGISL
jgi:hypothetical protein